MSLSAARRLLVRRNVSRKNIEAMKSPENLIWIDLEMNRFEAGVRSHHRNRHDRNRQTPQRARGRPVLAVRQVRRRSTRWTIGTGGSTAIQVLSARVLASDVDAAVAESATLKFLEAWAEPGRSPMCGNSICQDRRFLARLMPRLEGFFHYRPQSRREHAQGTGAALGAAGRAGLPEIIHPPGRWTTCASRIRELQFYRERLLRNLSAISCRP